jgi:hypothetical protein
MSDKDENEYRELQNKRYLSQHNNIMLWASSTKDSKYDSFDHIVTKVAMEVLGYKSQIPRVKQLSGMDGMLNFSAFCDEYTPFIEPPVLHKMKTLNPLFGAYLNDFTQSRFFKLFQKNMSALSIFPMHSMMAYGGYAMHVIDGVEIPKRGSVLLSVTPFGLVAHGRLDYLLQYLLLTGDVTLYTEDTDLYEGDTPFYDEESDYTG